MAEPWIDDVEALDAIYDTAPAQASLRKVARRLTPTYRKWIMASRFCIVSTVGPEGADGSPRGDDGPVVSELNAGTLALPDWHGNNRVDTLRNVVRDGRIALLFMVPGCDNMVRVNGRGRVSAGADLRARFQRDGKQPRTVIVIAIEEVYFQCARAIRRSGLWNGQGPDDLPTAGDILAEMTQGDIDGAAYDAEWPKRADKTLW
ncbi:pyridoxamine 5'-phosphate oxidase family protein [Aliiroseovarius sp. PTFE2010]|uniref:pyridoxamine 5'-phosphate oxidase family protein n=1 Tax=Aliiroseovarius sp. PTFE2010 TaxID=3417190 RepID=UPI003CED0A29